MMKYLDQIINWIRLEVKNANAKGVIVGISGGIDSALVGYLAKQAFPNNSLGILMPINKERSFDVDHGLELVKKFNLDYKIIDLNSDYVSISNKIQINSNLTKGNLQARLRMSVLYAFAQENNYLVLGTDNKAEYELGYFTKYGDGGCDLLPIVHLFKSEVFEYAKKVGVPESIINKKPSAGLWENQTDEDELGFSYDDFEKYCKNEKINQNIKNKIEDQIKKTQHKRLPIKMAPARDLVFPKKVMNWLNNIEDHKKQERLMQIISDINCNFPQLTFDIKWNQIIIMMNKTFILGLGTSKNYINIAPEEIVVSKFESKIKALDYENTKNLIKIKDNKDINISFIKDIVNYNMNEKKNATKFWR